MKAKAVCFLCIRKLWQACAITLVLLAVVVSILKYSLPYANNYKGELEDYLYDKFAVKLSIGAISASWQASGPAIVMQEIAIQSSNNSPIALTISKASLELDVWQSLKEWQLKSNYFVINAAHVNIDVPMLLKSRESGTPFEQKELFEGLFLGETGHFEIKNSSVNFLLSDQKERRLILKNIVWQNSLEQHNGSGRLALPGISDGTFDARLVLTGETLEAMAGDVYLHANEVDVSKWLAQYSNKDKQSLKSDLNVESWLSVEKGTISDVTVKWLPSHITWQQGKNSQSHQISISEGGFHLYPWQQGWRLKSTGLAINDEQHRWPNFQFEAQLGDKQQQFWLQQLDVDLVNQLAQLSNYDVLDTVIKRAPTGQIDHAYVQYSSTANWQVWFAAQNIGWLAQQGIPGANDLRIDAMINQERGRISLFGESNSLRTDDIFAQPINYNQLNIDLDLAKTSQGWQLNSNDIWLDNNEITLAGEMKLTLGKSPRLDLYAEAFAPDASVANHYFPLTLMSKNLVEYLTSAIKEGEVTQAQVLFSGPLSGFPFADNSGQFEVLAQVDDATYKFAPDWPALTNGSVKLHFENERMDIYSQQGELVNLAIDDSVHVSINDLMKADVLTVKINKRARASALLPFFEATPISDPLANVFTVIQGQGKANADIELTVDLNDLNVNAKGLVTLNNLPVFISQPGIQLEDVTGRLYFNDDHVELKNAKANWLGMPIEFNFNGKNVAQTYRGDIDITAKLNADTLTSHAQGVLKGYLQGDSDVTVKVALNFLPDGFNYNAKVSSQLIGLTSNLPMPYTKRAEQAWPLTAQVQGDNISNLITANINNRLYFNSILANDTGKMKNAHLIVGKQDLGLNQQDFLVSIDLDKTALLPWVGLIEQIITAGQVDSESEGVLPPLKAVVGTIHTLSIDDIVFNDLEMRLQPKQDTMDLRLNAKELRSQITIPLNEKTRPILINSDYLRVNFKPQLAKKGAVIAAQSDHDFSWLNNLPSIEFECSDCKVATYQLDKVSASLYGDGHKLTVSEIIVDKGEHILHGKGQWQNDLTQVSGDLQSDDIGELFDEFDITSTVKDSNAKVKFDLTWHGAPYQLDIPSLSGDLAWDLGEGHLTEVSDGGARVFSLLSLDSLVRKLKLDFRDVFSKGFFYNNFRGTMQLDKGIAYTQDTKIDGVPADLTIKGHTNLNNLQINYDLAVAPQVTSSIPVIVAWMVNPVTGLAALALDKVIHSARVISEINFKVTGTTNDPVVNEVDRKSREVTIPQTSQNQPHSDSQAQQRNPLNAAATVTQ